MDIPADFTQELIFIQDAVRLMHFVQNIVFSACWREKEAGK